jgi:hypothetical protein
MVTGAGCVYRYDMNTSSPHYCPNAAEGGLGGYCREHAMENPNNPNRCLMQIPPGEPGNETGTTDLRCKGQRAYDRSPTSYCEAHRPD